ncbi:GRB2-associated-binding protein 3 isoform X1 [Lepisosteus oculatus]|uniref:GRB2 associated binding protein 3 n=2 Tax=Lepisosteus oculatus TaxID=7918 RepID=W5NBG4_LEPOC|nr:PREDICTED: GRB2-associated-binding protein 3 isoform X1 [Lepisosteus oculatus]
MSAGDVVFTGWLIKSPPEKKLKRYAWRKRWFVLRRGRMSGNPDVLEYYRTKTSKKPIRVINLNECEVQIHSEVRVVKREFQNHHVFVVKTSFRVFYLVAKTEEEMNNWVHNISQICHFGPLDERADSVDSLSQTPSSQQPSPAVSTHTSRNADDGLFSTHDLTADTNTTKESRSESDSSLPLDYLFLSQCETGRFSITRCNSWSNSERSLEQNSSDNAFEEVFLSPLCPNQLFSPLSSTGPSDSPPSVPSSSTPLEKSPHTVQHVPNIFQFDKPPSALSLEAGVECNTPPPRPPKPSRFSERRPDEPSPHIMLKNGDGAYALQPGIIPRRISLAGLDHVRRGEFEGNSARNWSKRLSLNLPLPAAANSSSSVDTYEDSYVPMNPGASPPVSSLDCSPDGYIPMSPTSMKFLLSGNKTDPIPTAVPLPELPDDLEPPPVNRDLKPRRRTRPPPLDLRGLSTIREYPTHLPLTRTMTEPCNPTHCVLLEGRLGAGGNLGEEEENCISTDSRQLVFPTNENAIFPLPRKSNLDYLSLDFNSASPSPVQKKPLLADEHRVDYVQVDEKKTQALQNTKMEWKDVRQSKV